MKKVKVVYQMEHSECGLAVAASLINFFKEDVNLAELRERYGVPLGGLSFLKIKYILGEYGISTKTVRIKDYKILEELPTPLIAYVDNNHFVIIERIVKDGFYVIDPAIGRIKYKKNKFYDFFSGIVMFTNEKPKKSMFKLKINMLVKKIMLSNKKIILYTFIATMVTQLTVAMSSYAVKFLIDNRVEILSKNSYLMLAYSSIYFAIIYFASVCRTLLLTNLQISIEYILNSETLERLLNLPLKFFINRSSGELIFRINSNTFIKSILSERIISVLLDLIFSAFYVLLMFNFSLRLTLITLIFAMLIVLFAFINGRFVYRINQDQNMVTTDIQKIISEVIMNISTIKSVTAEDKMLSNWNEKFNQSKNYEIKKGKYSAFIATIPSILQIFFPIFILVYGLFTSNDSTGTVIAFTSLGAGFLLPMSSLAASYTELLIIKVYISKLTDIFLSTVEDNTEYSSENIILKNGNISLQNVSYRFDKFSENVLNNINLNICDGEKVAIIGPSGSGKSTLIRLIAGLLDIETGEIKVSGNNLKFFKKKVYRKQLGIVTQDSQVFSGTFRENILMGRNFSDEHIIDCAKKVNLIDLINDLPLGLDTLISEDGNNLSGGQKQRIAICRAIINNPKILVFDEPTSSLDNISERIIMHNIFKERTTVIVVAHRLGMIDAFDKVILMNKGIVEAVGTNKELLSENLLYRKLVNKNEK